jgi:hypothetical protein
MNLLRLHDATGRTRGIVMLSVLLGLTVGACTFDASDRCGPHQVIYGDNERCVCEEGAALTATGCVPCGEHEVPGATGCSCENGFTRPSAGGACEAAPTGLGAACGPDQACADATYDHCATGANQSGYCTSVGCSSSSECPSGYACATSATPSFCQRPPLGLGKSCSSAADCAGLEADFCDTFQSHQCLVQGCSLAADDCFEGSSCCDLSNFGMPEPLCLPPGACPQ